MKIQRFPLLENEKIKPLKYKILEIKPCGLGSRIRDVEAFCYKTEIKIIYFVPLCLIVSDCMVYPDPTILS